MYRTAEEALQFFTASEWTFTRSLSYRLGGGVGNVVGSAQWKPWPYPVTPGSVASVDGASLPDRADLLLYAEVRSTPQLRATAKVVLSYAMTRQEGQLQLQGIQEPLRVSRQYAFNCAKLPVEVFFIGGKLGSGGSSVTPGEVPSISCEDRREACTVCSSILASQESLCCLSNRPVSCVRL